MATSPCPLPPAHSRWTLIWVSHLPSSVNDSNLAHSHASTRWQQGLRAALALRGVELVDATVEPCAAFPRGPLLKGRQPLVNLPRIRDWQQARRTLRALPVRLAGIVPVAAVSFELSRYARLVGGGIERAGIAPWIPIVGEGPSGDDARHPQHAIERARRGVVYLSYERWRRSPAAHKLHLDGGIDWRLGETQTLPFVERSPCRLLCTGGGVAKGEDLLLAAMALVPSVGCELHLVGRRWGVRPGGVRVGQTTVWNHGILDDVRLDALARDTDIFVSCYPPQFPRNAENFPSKILYFLGFGRPVVCTMAGGIAPEYRDVVVPVEEGTPQALANGIERARQMTAAERDALQRRIRSFILEGRTWDLQAERLLAWLCDALTPTR